VGRRQYVLADPTHVDLHVAGTLAQTLAQTLAAQRRSEDTPGDPRLLIPARSTLVLVTELAPHARDRVRPALGSALGGPPPTRPRPDPRRTRGLPPQAGGHGRPEDLTMS
jgi:hypothetical protein